MYRFALLAFWHDSSLIHPDDLEDLKNHFPHGLGFMSFEELGCEADYQILSLQDWGLPVKDQTFRIKPGALKELPPTKFAKGQSVASVTGTPRTGWIYAIVWHFKREKHIYLLEVQSVTGKRKKISRYYDEEDLEVVRPLDIK